MIERLYNNGYLLSITIIVILVAGLAAMAGLPRIEDPRLTNRNPIVLTAFPGADADRVETLVTDPIEENLRSIPEIKELESTSRDGFSTIAIELTGDVGPNQNEEVFSKIRDRVAQTILPAGVLKPLVDDQRGAVAFTSIVTLSWEHDSPPRLGILRRHARELADRLRLLPGTELVRLYGEPEEEFLVEVDPSELAALQMTPAKLSQQIASADAKAPAGVVRTGSSGLTLEVAGQLDSISRINQIPLQVGSTGLARNNDTDTLAGDFVRVGDIAQVERTWRQPTSTIGLADGRRAIYVAARMKPGIRVDQWSPKAANIIEEYRGQLGRSVTLDTFFDQSQYTNARLGELAINLLAGGGLILIIIFVTMGYRRSLIVGLALPLVVAMSLFVMFALGQSLQQMSIFGLILALGLLIDNAIVVVDETRTYRDKGMSSLAAAKAAVEHLFVPLLASTVTTVLAFAPIVLLPGNIGEFVGSIGSSVIISVSMSFAISMSIIAVLAARFDNNLSTDRSEDGIWQNGFSSTSMVTLYRRVLQFLIGRPWAGVTVSALPALVGFGLAATMGSQFFPRVDRNMFQVEVWMPPQSTTAGTALAAARVEDCIREFEDVRQVHWLIGGNVPSVFYNVVMNKDGASNFAQAIVTTRDAASVKSMLAKLQDEVGRRVPESQVIVSQFGQGPPVEAPIQLRVFGPDLEELQRIGEEVRRVVQQHPQVIHTQVSMPRGKPVLMVRPDEHAVRLTGLGLNDLAGQLQAGLDGTVGGSILEDNEELPVRVRYADAVRNDLESVRTLPVGLSSGGSIIPLSSLGEVTLEPKIGAIGHRDGFRCNTIKGYVTGDALPIEISRQINQRLAEIPDLIPPRYRVSVGGDAEEQASALGNLSTYVPVLVTITLASLILAFRSVLLAMVLVVVAALSIGLGLLSTWSFNFPISFNTILGCLGLIGVALNDSIVVISAIRTNSAAIGGDVTAIVDEIVGCTRHILSTTLTTAGGFLPLILAGGDFWPPLAVVIAGGVIGATVLALVFVPATCKWIAPLLQRPGKTLQPA